MLAGTSLLSAAVSLSASSLQGKMNKSFLLPTSISFCPSLLSIQRGIQYQNQAEMLVSTSGAQTPLWHHWPLSASAEHGGFVVSAHLQHPLFCKKPLHNTVQLIKSGLVERILELSQALVAINHSSVPKSITVISY